MSNRRFEMYEYRQVIHRMRMGESDRTIARTGLMGRIKCGQIRAIDRLRHGAYKILLDGKSYRSPSPEPRTQKSNCQRTEKQPVKGGQIA